LFFAKEIILFSIHYALTFINIITDLIKSFIDNGNPILRAYAGWEILDPILTETFNSLEIKLEYLY
jgi:hypothetical protein